MANQNRTSRERTPQNGNDFRVFESVADLLRYYCVRGDKSIAQIAKDENLGGDSNLRQITKKIDRIGAEISQHERPGEKTDKRVNSIRNNPFAKSMNNLLKFYRRAEFKKEDVYVYFYILRYLDKEFLKTLTPDVLSRSIPEIDEDMGTPENLDGVDTTWSNWESSTLRGRIKEFVKEGILVEKEKYSYALAPDMFEPFTEEELKELYDFVCFLYPALPETTTVPGYFLAHTLEQVIAFKSHTPLQLEDWEHSQKKGPFIYSQNRLHTVLEDYNVWKLLEAIHACLPVVYIYEEKKQKVIPMKLIYDEDLQKFRLFGCNQNGENPFIHDVWKIQKIKIQKSEKIKRIQKIKKSKKSKKKPDDSGEEKSDQPDIKSRHQEYDRRYEEYRSRKDSDCFLIHFDFHGEFYDWANLKDRKNLSTEENRKKNAYENHVRQIQNLGRGSTAKDRGKGQWDVEIPRAGIRQDELVLMLLEWGGHATADADHDREVAQQVIDILEETLKNHENL